MPFGASRLSFLALPQVEVAAGRTAKTLSANGDTEVDTAVAKFGSGSVKFTCSGATNGTTDTLVTNTSDDFIFAGDLTWECWVYMIDNGTNDTYTFLSNRGGFTTNNLYIAARQLDNKWQWGNSTMGANVPTNTWSYNTWYHVALVRNGTGTGNFAFYVNGTQLQTDTDTNTLGGGGQNFISMGGIDAATDNFGLNGHMDEVRISTTARYTSSFTAPTSSFTNDGDTVLLVHCDGVDGSTAFEDDIGDRSILTIAASGNAQVSTSQSKFGGASAYFDGVDDYVHPVNLSSLLSDVGTGDWTFECWFKTSDTTFALFDNREDGSTAGTVALLAGGNANGKIDLYYNNGFRIFGPTTVNNNAWRHIAVVKSSNSIQMYVDGSTYGSSYADTNSLTTNNTMKIGVNFVNGYDYIGYIDELRISNTARYTSTFTPSTSAFTNDDNTILLLHMDGSNGSTTFADDNS